MVVIGLRFTAGRFHATAWGRHVNEGALEWPPSPWRLMRALVATWKRKLPDRMSEGELRELLQALSSPPSFALPPATTGHTRHYMPWFKKGPGDRVLVFDAFLAIDRRFEVGIVWTDAAVSPGQLGRLRLLLEHVGYFGRAESWCTVRVVESEAAWALTERVNCCPVNPSDPSSDVSVVRVLCPDPTTMFGKEEFAQDKRASPGWGRAGKERRLYDPEWHLCAETAWLQSEGWSSPPGSRWVLYSRSKDSLEERRIRPGRLVTRQRAGALPQVARYVLDSSVLPLVSQALPTAEQVRIQLMGIHRRLEEERLFGQGEKTPAGRPVPRSAIFSGKDATGRPLKGHGHAFFLPTDEDGDGRLDHLTIVAETGFEDKELGTLDRLRRLHREEGSPALNLLLMGLTRLPTMTRGPLPLQPSRTWISATPFIATRHPKRRGTKRDAPELLATPAAFLTANLQEELGRLAERRSDLLRVADVSVQPLPDKQGAFRIMPRLWSRAACGPDLRPIQFKRFRRKRGDDGGRRLAGAFRLTFSEPVRGPICLGHSAHFGMGLFLPELPGHKDQH